MHVTWLLSLCVVGSAFGVILSSSSFQNAMERHKIGGIGPILCFVLAGVNHAVGQTKMNVLFLSAFQSKVGKTIVLDCIKM